MVCSIDKILGRSTAILTSTYTGQSTTDVLLSKGFEAGELAQDFFIDSLPIQTSLKVAEKKPPTYSRPNVHFLDDATSNAQVLQSAVNFTCINFYKSAIIERMQSALSSWNVSVGTSSKRHLDDAIASLANEGLQVFLLIGTVPFPGVKNKHGSFPARVMRFNFLLVFNRIGACHATLVMRHICAGLVRLRFGQNTEINYSGAKLQDAQLNLLRHFNGGTVDEDGLTYLCNQLAPDAGKTRKLANLNGYISFRSLCKRLGDEVRYCDFDHAFRYLVEIKDWPLPANPTYSHITGRPLQKWRSAIRCRLESGRTGGMHDSCTVTVYTPICTRACNILELGS